MTDLSFVIKMQDQASAAAKAFFSGIAGGVGPLNQLSDATGKANKALEEHGKKAREASSGLKLVAENFENASEAVLGFFASFELAQSALEASDALTASLFRIQRASMMTTEEVEKFGEAIEDVVDKSSGRATEKEILGISEAAAKVGFSKESLASFTEGMIRLGVASQGMGATMATSIGQILEVTEGSTAGFKDYQNELALVNQLTGVAVDSLVMHARALATATAASNLSKEAVTGLAVIMDSLGGRFSAAANAVQQVFTAISTDSVRSREGIRQLSVATHESQAALQALATSAPEQVFIKILKHVQELNGQRLAQQNFLSEFNVVGGESAKLIGELSNKGADLQDIINKQLGAKGSTEALEKLAGDTPRLFGMAVTNFTNAVEKMAASVGKLISPEAIKFLDALSDGIRKVAGWLDNMNPYLATAAANVVVFGSALGGLYKTFGLLKEIGIAVAEGWGLSKLFAGAAGAGKLIDGAAIAVEGVEAAGGVALVSNALKAVNDNSAILKVGVVGAAETVGVAVGGLVGKVALAGTVLKSIFTGVMGGFLGWLVIIPQVISGLLSLNTYLNGMSEKGYSNSQQLHVLWRDAYALVGDKQGVATQQGILDASFAEDKRTQTGTFDSKLTQEARRRAKDEASIIPINPAEVAAKATYDKEHTLTNVDEGFVSQALGIHKASVALEDYRLTLTKIEGMTSGERAAQWRGFSDDDLVRLRESVVLEERKADPIANQLRLGALALDKQKAVTADLKLQVDIRDALNAAFEKDPSIENKPDVQKAITDQVKAAADIARNNAIQDTLRGLDEQIAKQATIGVQAQNELEIAIKLDAFRRANVGADTSVYESHLRAGQQLTNASSVVNSYLPQISGALKLKDAEDQINMARQAGQITSVEQASAMQKLHYEMLQQVSPLGAIVRSSQEEAAAAALVGPYREQEAAALQTILDLKKQGVIAENENTDALQGALTKLNEDMADLQKMNTMGFNGFVNSVGTLTDQLGKAESSFSEGMSGAIVGALTRQRFAFIQAGEQMGKAMLTQGVNDLMAEGMKAVGLAGPNKAQQDKIKIDQDDVAKMGDTIRKAMEDGADKFRQASQALAGKAGVDITNPDAPYAGVAAGNSSTIMPTDLHGPSLSPQQQLTKAMGGNVGSPVTNPVAPIPGVPLTSTSSPYGTLSPIAGSQASTGDMLTDVMNAGGGNAAASNDIAKATGQAQQTINQNAPKLMAAPGVVSSGSGSDSATATAAAENAAPALAEQALGDAVPGAKPLISAFKTISSLWTMPNGLGSVLGGAGAGASAAIAPGASDALSSLGDFAMLYHSGGLVGNDNTMFRAINPALFAAAKRYHDGLGDDEFPAVLQRGERVLTASQDQRNAATMSRLTDAIANSSSPAGTSRPQLGGATNHMTMIVNAKDASSFRNSSAQIQAMTHSSMARVASKHN